MALVTGEVIPDPHGSRSYLVVFKHGKDLIGQWPCSSIEHGQSQIVKALKEMSDRFNETSGLSE